ncbi:hypothetical protein PABG_11752 [Paracoccidioides brasiliensis Pb03]|nr:hypothetical protein PABG_11752 [Paracoccidioides brasiliensis Pb03]
MPLTREVYYPTGLVDRGSDVYLFARIIFVLLYRGTCGEVWEVILGSDGRCGAGPDADADADAGINATVPTGWLPIGGMFRTRIGYIARQRVKSLNDDEKVQNTQPALPSVKSQDP